MKIVGLIVEYNPFHNGHFYHLKKAKEITNADYIIAITSTYFSMRGDVSIIDKYQKTQVAIEAGVDILIELPYLLGCQNADIFAKNAVNLLQKMGVDTIVSGSELGDIKLIETIHNIEKSTSFQNDIKAYLDKGNSYRKSFSNALEKNNLSDLGANDLLNLKYYDAIKENNFDIQLVLIKRINNNYHDQNLNDTNIQSATAIRKTKELKNNVPDFAYNIYKEKPLLEIDAFNDIYNHSVLTTNLKEIFEAKEGIENKFKPCDSLSQLITNLATKRYTASRISRFISYIITNTTKDKLNFSSDYPIRILGFNQNGQRYLNSIKKQVNFFTRLIDGIHPIYDYELKIAKIFSNVYKRDFIQLEQKLPHKK